MSTSLKVKPFLTLEFRHVSQLGVSEKFTLKFNHLEHHSSLTRTDNSNQLQALTRKHCTSNPSFGKLENYMELHLPSYSYWGLTLQGRLALRLTLELTFCDGS